MLKKLTPVLFFFAVLGTSVVCANNNVEQSNEMTKEEKLVLLEGVALGNELIKNALETGNLELIEQLQSDEQDIEEAHNIAITKKTVLTIAGITAACGLAALGYWKKAWIAEKATAGFAKSKDVAAKVKALFARKNNDKVQEEVAPVQPETPAQNETLNHEDVQPETPAQTEALAQEETPAPAPTEPSAPAELAA
ncbi:MAG: hypothetical protein US69_C0016G0008 [candidate division TM6 bacterium GW2011_GWF2_38_10]|nr:MAG: hypothetical protein US69_C0016G0008 [candidate division TM6 bacterium GW2011_GWF2_38_10]